MTGPLLSLRLNRRAIAAATLSDERLEFFDGRHLTSNRERATTTVERYIRKILELTRPSNVVIDAPTDEESSTAKLLEAILAVLKDAQIDVRFGELPNVLRAYGKPTIKSRLELRAILEPFWPELEAVRGQVKPLVVDAAGLALYADVERALGIPLP